MKNVNIRDCILEALGRKILYSNLGTKNICQHYLNYSDNGFDLSHVTMLGLELNISPHQLSAGCYIKSYVTNYIHKLARICLIISIRFQPISNQFTPKRLILIDPFIQSSVNSV